MVYLIRSWGRTLGVLALALAALPVHAQSEEVEVVRAFPNLTFEQPLYLGHAGDGSGRLYVGEYGGVVKSFVAREDAEPADVSVFLDVSDRSREFYAIAFHPDYETNGYVYVSYVTDDDPIHSILARYTRSASDPHAVDPASELVLLDLEQPTVQHNGGDLAFGPDGYLYLALGDGGTDLDVAGHAQDPTTLLGSVLRLDVDHPAPGLNYGIPRDNPFVGNSEGWREEIWAYGFRNPYRISFDRETGHLWLGDVGEELWEEIDLVEAGGNYGWPIMEGPDCLNGLGCDPTGLTPPFYAYTHDEGISVTGGMVYRGSEVPALQGHYVFGDWGFEKLWALDVSDPATAEHVPLDPPDSAPTTGFITDVGEDEDGELYYTAMFRGFLYGFAPTKKGGEVVGEEVDVPPALTLKYAAPNPFRGQMSLAFALPEPGLVRIAVYDVLGREVAVLFDGPAREGTQATRFRAGSLPAGVYTIRMQSGGQSVTRRVTLVR